MSNHHINADSCCDDDYVAPEPLNPEEYAPFIQPTRRILTQKDLDIFTESPTREMLLGFIIELNESVKGKTNDEEVYESEAVGSVYKLLQVVETLVKNHPPADAVSSRFGKLEFRDFYDDLSSKVTDLLNDYILPHIPKTCNANRKGIILELKSYLIDSWGNRTRIDYGSGHELNFMTFLLCLNIVGVINVLPVPKWVAESIPSLSPPATHDTKDAPAVVLKLFLKYLSVMRLIQTTYWLEPAGSHGVWGLDDYHFLPFLFGSSQLSTHKHLRPVSIHDVDILEMYGPKYMYLGCIAFINKVKTASLRWHSPMLDDISGVKKWSKVNEGMIKMYKAEVLGKLPIMQHYMFGHLVPAPEGVSPPPAPGQALPHVHSNWADCCGIKVPSAIAASQMENKKEHLRPVTGMIPFD